MNKLIFETPSTPAPNKEGLAHPMDESQGLSQARLVTLQASSPQNSSLHVTCSINRHSTVVRKGFFAAGIAAAGGNARSKKDRREPPEDSAGE